MGLAIHLQIKTFTDNFMEYLYGYLYGISSAVTPMVFKEQVNILKGIKKAMHLS